MVLQHKVSRTATVALAFPEELARLPGYRRKQRVRGGACRASPFAKSVPARRRIKKGVMFDRRRRSHRPINADRLQVVVHAGSLGPIFGPGAASSTTLDCVDIVLVVRRVVRRGHLEALLGVVEGPSSHVVLRLHHFQQIASFRGRNTFLEDGRAHEEPLSI